MPAPAVAALRVRVVIIIIIATIVAYGVGAGVMHAVARHRGWSFDYHNDGEWVAVVIWPVFLPALLAAMLTTRLLERGRVPEARVHKEGP